MGETTAPTVPHRLRSAAIAWPAPLSLLRMAPPPLVVAVVAASAVQWAFPVLATFAAGVVVVRVAEAGPPGAAVTAVLVLSVLLIAQQLAAIAVAPLRDSVARAIDGRFRRAVAQASLAPAGIAHLTDPASAGKFALASRDLDQFTPGNAASAQVTVVCQALAAAGCAVVIGHHAPLWGLVTAALALSRRLAVQRLFVGLNWVKIRSADSARRYRHWQSFAGGAEAAKEIRIFGLQDWAVERYRAASLHYFRPIWQARKPVLLRNWLPLLLGAGLLFSGLYALVPAHGPADARPVVQCITALVALFAASSTTWEDFEVAHGRPMIEVARELRTRLPAGTNAPAPAPRLPPPGLPPPAGPPRIAFEDVHFHYPGHATPVLAGLDLEIRPGEVLAVVGANGAGKTTAIKLLARLYEPASGRITVDGTDIGDLPVDQWRRTLAVVVQGFLRHDASLRDNVALGAPERLADTGFFASVAPGLDLDDIVDTLPHGWDTPLSRGRTGGTELSGGQWQRIALARALFALRAGRSMLILDEPTAQLDAEAEFDVFRKVIDAARGAGVLLISHRLSTVRLADRIVVIRDGRAVEAGTHQQLLGHGADYAHMFHTQARQFLGTG